MAFGKNLVSWFTRQLIKFLIHIIALAFVVGTVYVLYLKFGDIAYFALLAFGTAYLAVIKNLINSFVNEVLFK